MDTAIVVALIGAAATVIAAVASALIQRSRLSAPTGTAAATALVGRAVHLTTFRSRLAFGLSALAVLVGLAAACYAPGGWLSRPVKGPSSWENTVLTDLSERLGFQPWTLVPATGLLLALIGAIGIVLAWAASAPPLPRSTTTDAAPDQQST